MFGRFTDEARRVLDLALNEARTLNSIRVGTEHILLGLVQEGDGTSRRGAGVAGDQPGRGPPADRGDHRPGPWSLLRSHQQYTLRAKRALDLSLREALQLGHHHIGTEHILLGLLREGEGPAAQVLIELGADLSLVRQQVLRLLAIPAVRAARKRICGRDRGGGHRASEHAADRHGGPGTGTPAEPGTGTAARAPGRRRRRAAWPQAEARATADRAPRPDRGHGRAPVSRRASLGSGPDVHDLDRQIAQARQTRSPPSTPRTTSTRRRCGTGTAAARRQGLAAEGMGRRAPGPAVPGRRAAPAQRRGRPAARPARQKGIESRDGAA